MNKIQHSIGVTGAKDDLGVTTSPTPQNDLNAGSVIGSEQADIDTDPPLGVQKIWPPQATHDTIHYTVRVLLAKKNHSCRVLKNFCTVSGGENSQQVSWRRLEDQNKGKSRNLTTKVDPQLSIDEAEVTEQESKLLKLWLGAAAERGMSYSHSKEARVNFRLVGASLKRQVANSTSHTYSFTSAEDAKNLLETMEDETSLHLSILLYAYLEESMKPTLMYSPNTTGTTH
jgi:hypothetical protein